MPRPYALACDGCGGRRRIIAAIADAKVARKILTHLGLAVTGAASEGNTTIRGPPRSFAIVDTVDEIDDRWDAWDDPGPGWHD